MSWEQGLARLGGVGLESLEPAQQSPSASLPVPQLFLLSSALIPQPLQQPWYVEEGEMRRLGVRLLSWRRTKPFAAPGAASGRALDRESESE